MPIKKIGEGAQARYNQSRPTVSFRVPHKDWKQNLKHQAKLHGMGLSEYIVETLGDRIYGDPEKPAPWKDWKKPTPTPKQDSSKDELAKALDELTGSFPPEFE